MSDPVVENKSWGPEVVRHILATAGYQDIRIRFFEPRRAWYGLMRQTVVVERWQDAGIGAYITPLTSFTIRPVPELAGHDFRAPAPEPRRYPPPPEHRRVSPRQPPPEPAHPLPVDIEERGG